MLLIQIWNRPPIGRDQSDALPRALQAAARSVPVPLPQMFLGLRTPTTDECVLCDGGSCAETSVDLAAPLVLIAERIGGARPKREQRLALARALGEAAKSVLGPQRQVRVLVRDSRLETDAHWTG